MSPDLPRSTFLFQRYCLSGRVGEDWGVIGEHHGGQTRRYSRRVLELAVS